MQALAASLPLFFFFISLLILACLIFSQVKIPKPIGFGVLTCENIKQAEIRSDVRKKNKGKEAANACIKLL